jgi:hypothetical protein
MQPRFTTIGEVLLSTESNSTLMPINRSVESIGSARGRPKTYRARARLGEVSSVC